MDNDCDGITDNDADTDNDTIYNCLDLDDDNDGMPDVWEELYPTCLDPLINDANGDCDGDGYRNIIEMVADSNPGDETSLPDYVEVFGLDLTPTTDYNMVALCLEETGFLYASNLCGAITGCQVISRWVAERQGYDDYIIGFPFTDYPLAIGEGYFVGVTTASSFDQSGIIPDLVQFSLITTETTDYNVISVPYGMFDIQMAADLCDSIPGCQVVSKWVADRQGYDDYIDGLPFTDFAVEPGHPYFIGVLENSIWP